MQPAVSEKIIYEHPLNERTRTFLRLEHLFRQTNHHLPNGDIWSSRAAIDALLDIINIFGRADIKADLIKELDRHRNKLSAIKQTHGVDVERLQQILNELENITRQLHQINGQVCQDLRENEFLKSIMQRSSIPGGSCAFDLPMYHFWLEQPAELRHAKLQEWINTLAPIQAAISLILSLIRGSTRPTREEAPKGFYQHSLDAQTPVQLIRVGLQKENGLFAEISGGKHRFSVRFLEPNDADRPTQTQQDVTFFLNCCIL
ncbi:cell division protein ZapD [Solemya velesiana gill symbiont]|uniref:Cell division protein ZapD n=1 Tax=Solemya velesiana gill symbiont TaxID=1918948 RepID=A0A1T2KWV0_9GAMM|nr:cell division protein ZapD [Solemya velesiana gill symbiont]OOZ37302.1 cell division protein ZapD [Solemya velesiana gill symbiont]